MRTSPTWSSPAIRPRARELFSANKSNKAIYLDNDFHQQLQGASSIIKYVLPPSKEALDSLADNDSTLSTRTLVLNTMRGLGPLFVAGATVISMIEPLPSFLWA
jgi:hypothetical protein